MKNYDMATSNLKSYVVSNTSIKYINQNKQLCF